MSDHRANWTPEQEAKMQAALQDVRDSAEKFGPLGRPADSACACKQWPCPCPCHRPPRRKT